MYICMYIPELPNDGLSLPAQFTRRFVVPASLGNTFGHSSKGGAVGGGCSGWG